MARKKLKARKNAKVVVRNSTQVLGYVNTSCISYAFNYSPSEVKKAVESMSQFVQQQYQLAVLRSLTPYIGEDE